MEGRMLAIPVCPRYFLSTWSQNASRIEGAEVGTGVGFSLLVLGYVSMRNTLSSNKPPSTIGQARALHNQTS